MLDAQEDHTGISDGGQPVVVMIDEALPLRSTNPNNQLASYDGAGTLEILALINLLKEAGITCCIVGISALIYFGAARVRNDWEICVPTEKLDSVSALLKAHDGYEVAEPSSVQLWSLLHTFLRFKFRQKYLWFILVPSEDAHIECSASKIERSRMGLPYPKLQIFAQSLLDTNDRVGLTDLADGMDLTEGWGLQYLKLDGKNDVAWMEQKNERIRCSVPMTEDSCLLELPDAPVQLDDIWHKTVREKIRRLGTECPKEVYATRFRCHGEGDPRLRDRTEV